MAILHQDLERTEYYLRDNLAARGVAVDLCDIRDVSLRDLMQYDLVVNRIYASVANRCWRDNLKCLALLHALEAEGIMCINGVTATRADYSKSFAAELLQKAGVSTPATLKLDRRDDAELAVEFAEHHGYPIVIKRDMGGRGEGICRVEGREQLTATLQRLMISDNRQNDYAGGYVVQEFVRSVRTHDCRITIVDGRFVSSFARGLIALAGESPWLASLARGSELFDYTPSPEELETAVAATQAIRAVINEVDMQLSNEGPVIIENNPTPNYYVVEGHEPPPEFVNLLADRALQ